MGIDSLDVDLEPSLLACIGAGSELDDRVEWNLDVGELFVRVVHKVGVDAAQNGLMSDDQNVALSLQLHDNGLQPKNNIAVRLSSSIAVVELVLISVCKVLGVLLLSIVK